MIYHTLLTTTWIKHPSEVAQGINEEPKHHSNNQWNNRKLHDNGSGHEHNERHKRKENTIGDTRGSKSSDKRIQIIFSKWMTDNGWKQQFTLAQWIGNTPLNYIV